MPDNTFTIVGNLTEDPVLRFTQGGAGVANITIAQTPRVYDKQSQEWKDGEALFIRGTIWKDAAENVADSLYKGVRVIVTGKLKQRSWEDDKTGGKRYAIEMDIDEIGASLKFAQVTVERKEKARSAHPNAKSDPWASDDDESPF